MRTTILIGLLSFAALGQACFCPSVISSSCGCGGGGGYGGGGSYYGGGGYPAANSGGYAVFYRDLTPFRQPMQYYPPPSGYPNGPAPVLPPMNRLPNPRYIQPPPPPPLQPQPQPQPQPQYHPPQSQNVAPAPYSPPKTGYLQPPATVAPLVESRAHVNTLHDNELGGGYESVLPTTTQAPAQVVEEEVPDFVDDEATTVASSNPEKVEEKEEFYYVYYDDKGKKVGDSRTGTTFAPQEIIETITDAVPTEVEVVTSVPTRTILETTTQQLDGNSETYDEIVEEETQAPSIDAQPAVFRPEGTTIESFVPTVAEATTVAASVAATPAPTGEVIYEDETVEYEDEKPLIEEVPAAKKGGKSATEYKRGLNDNQILVDASDNYNNGGSDNSSGYKNRVAASRGVKIVQRTRPEHRTLHSN